MDYQVLIAVVLNNDFFFKVLFRGGQDSALVSTFIKKWSENTVNKFKKKNIGLMISLKFSYSAVSWLPSAPNSLSLLLGKHFFINAQNT